MFVFVNFMAIGKCVLIYSAMTRRYSKCNSNYKGHCPWTLDSTLTQLKPSREVIIIQHMENNKYLNTMLSEFRKKIFFNNVFILFLTDIKPLKFSLLFKPLIFHYFFVTLKSHKEFFNQLMIKCELLLFGSFSTLCGKLPRVLTKVLAIIILSSISHQHSLH